MASLSVLTLHNRYQQPGGEDRVFTTETSLLDERGHRVIRYEEDNARVRTGALTSVSATWNHRSYRRIVSAVRASRPDVAHVHNTFPLISPAAYYALRRHRIPVVQKLSNFRLLCANALFLRDGGTCEDCLQNRSFVPALRHRCYRQSLPATAAITAMIGIHTKAGTWREMVDVYIALSQFSRRKFIEGGLPAGRIVVKPNFVAPDPGVGEGSGGYALFAGRLSQEKGIDTLTAAWSRLSSIPLYIAGDGPLASQKWPSAVVPLGFQPREQLLAWMKQAAFLVFPSRCYENCPVTILESLACGTPVIASDLGSMPEFVRHGHNGLLFRAGDPEDLARQIQWACEHPEHLRAMRRNARRDFEENYTADRNYKALISVYQQAMERSQTRCLETAKA